MPGPDQYWFRPEYAPAKWVPDHAYRPAGVEGYCVCGVPLRYHGSGTIRPIVKGWAGR